MEIDVKAFKKQLCVMLKTTPTPYYKTCMVCGKQGLAGYENGLNLTKEQHEDLKENGMRRFFKEIKKDGRSRGFKTIGFKHKACLEGGE